MRKTTVTAIFSLPLTGLLCWHLSAAAGVRQDVYKALDSLEGNWPEAGLDVAANGIQKLESVTVGETLQYSVRSKAHGSFAMMHVDSHGTATLIVPNCSAESTMCSYPTGGVLPVQPPLGKETLYVVMTERPLERSALGIAEGSSYLQSGDSSALAERFAGVVRQRALQGRIAVAKLGYLVEGAAGTTQYTTRAIIRQFEDGRETAISPVAVKKSLSANMIHFEFNSAQLTTQGKINLDVFGEAFLSGALERQVYILAGHTDDIGEEKYNGWLSLERAKTAKAYLVEHFGIDRTRIEVKGFGASNPMTPNINDKSRAMNRRVEFVRVQ